MSSNVPKKIIDGAKILMRIFEEDGPGPKTGLTYYLEKDLGKKVNRREFADMIHYCRRALGPRAGKAVLYNRNTDQYGFAEDLEAAEKYVILNRNKYLATSAETMSLVCDAAMVQHGPSSVELALSKRAHDVYAHELRALIDGYIGGIKAERAAKRLGVDAKIDLQERVV